MKKCNDCHIDKPTTEFYRSKVGKQGVEAICKSCRLIRNKRFRRENPGYYTEYSRRRRAAIKDGTWRGREKKTSPSTPTNSSDAQRGVQTP